MDLNAIWRNSLLMSDNDFTVGYLGVSFLKCNARKNQAADDLEQYCCRQIEGIALTVLASACRSAANQPFALSGHVHRPEMSLRLFLTFLFQSYCTLFCR